MMLGDLNVPTSGSAGLVSNTIGPTYGRGDDYAAYMTADLNGKYPKAVDGDGVYFFGPTDAPEMWVKTGSSWQLGLKPQRVIFDGVSGGDPRIDTIKSTSIGTGHIVLLGLLGLLLLRGAIK